MDKIIFLGDSITDAHRLWMPEYEGLGNGYVHQLREPLTEKYPGTVISNRGHDGFTMPFLLRTLERDCLRHHPDAVSVLIGINDVGISRNTGKNLADQEFGANYDTLLQRLLTQEIKNIFLMGPFLFPYPAEYLTWMEEVREVEMIIANTARRYQLPFLPLHDKMNQAAKDYGLDTVTTDGIHLTEFGHGLLAAWWWDAFMSSVR